MDLDQDAALPGAAKESVRPRNGDSTVQAVSRVAGEALPETPSLNGRTILLFATASGLAVANAYFAHPLLDVMADDLDLSRSVAGLIVGATQLGYGLACC